MLSLKNSFKLTLLFCIWSLKYFTSCGILGWSVIAQAHTHRRTCAHFLLVGTDHHLKWKSRSGSKSTTFSLVARLHGTHGSKEPRIHVYTACQRSLEWPEYMRRHTHTQNTQVASELLFEVILVISFISQYPIVVFYLDNSWMRRAESSVLCAV